eukprot:bmy_04598T0
MSNRQHAEKKPAPQLGGCVNASRTVSSLTMLSSTVIVLLFSSSFLFSFFALLVEAMAETIQHPCLLFMLTKADPQ